MAKERGDLRVGGGVQVGPPGVGELALHLVGGVGVVVELLRLALRRGGPRARQLVGPHHVPLTHVAEAPPLLDAHEAGRAHRGQLLLVQRQLPGEGDAEPGRPLHPAALAAVRRHEGHGAARRLGHVLLGQLHSLGVVVHARADARVAGHGVVVVHVLGPRAVRNEGLAVGEVALERREGLLAHPGDEARGAAVGAKDAAQPQLEFLAASLGAA